MRAGLYRGLKVAAVFSLATLTACGDVAPTRDLEGYSAEDIYK
ncbi:MAG: outer membrane protein assembly factor BamD, partial [Celeribacter sp.]